MDTDTNDIVSNGFGNTLTRDGQGSATANLPMNGFRHTGVGNGVARSDYASLGQVEDGTINWAIATGTADAIAASQSPNVTALVDGQLSFFRATAANATSAPTYALNGLTARTITKVGGAPLADGDIPGNLAECILRYNLANTRWELLNPAGGAVPVGAEMPFPGVNAPSGWLLEFGQTVSRTTYAVLFGVLAPNAIAGTAITGNTHTSTTIDGLSVDLRGLGLEGATLEGTGIQSNTTISSIGSATSMTISQATTGTATGIAIRCCPFGNGDGSTTFGIPDRRGRALFGRDNMGGTAASRLTLATSQGILGTKLSASGGEEAHTLTLLELAAHQHGVGLHDPGHTHTYNAPGQGGSTGTNSGGGFVIGQTGGTATGSSSTGVTVGQNSPSFNDGLVTSNGGSNSHNTVSPGGISNYIIKY